MPSETDIKAAIERVVKEKYSIWTIGATDNPSRRRTENRNPKSWIQWNADSEQAARNVESYFLGKNMKGGGSGSGRADYVYIF